jgi:hypothetical protein
MKLKKSDFLILFCFVSIWLVLYFQSLINELNFSDSFFFFDAQHYFQIVQHGYTIGETAFFPFFPLVWKFLNLSPLGISIVNSIIYFLSFFTICRLLNLKNFEIVLYSFIPSIVFFFQPYSEALFYFFSSLLIYGFVKKKDSIIILGLVLSGFCRPTAVIFLPSLFLVYLIDKETSLKRFFVYSTFVVISFLLVMIFQFLQTNVWFSFFEVQKSGWGNYLRIPTIPLNTWGGDNLLRYDSLAFFSGIIIGFYILKLLFYKLKNKTIEVSSEVVFSLGFIFFTVITILFFRGGMLFSLNRFVFATVFFPIILNHYFKLNFSFNKSEILLIIILLIASYSFFFGAYQHIQKFLKFLITSLIIISFLFYKYKNVNRNIFNPILIIIIFSLFLWTSNLIITGRWVG